MALLHTSSKSKTNEVATCCSQLPAEWSPVTSSSCKGTNCISLQKAETDGVLGGRGERKRKAPFPGPWKLDGCYVCILKDLRFYVKKSDILVLEKKHVETAGCRRFKTRERERREKRKKKEEGMIWERKGRGGVRTTGRLQACLQCFSHPGWLAADSWLSLGSHRLRGAAVGHTRSNCMS